MTREHNEHHNRLMASSPQSVRLSDANLEYIRGLVSDSGLSMAVIVDTLIGACRRRGWSVTRSGPAQIVEPS